MILVLLDGPSWPQVGHPYGTHPYAEAPAVPVAGQSTAAPSLELFGAELPPVSPAPGRAPKRPKTGAASRMLPPRCGGRLVWSHVPEQADSPDEQTFGVAVCERCGVEVYAWPNAYHDLTQASADALVEAAGDLGDDEDDAQTLRELLGITDEVRAAVRAWLSARPAPRTRAERSDLITAWMGSELAAQLEAGGAHGGTLLGLVTAACPRLEAAHG